MESSNTSPAELQRKKKRQLLFLMGVIVVFFLDLWVLDFALRHPFSWLSWMWILYPVHFVVLIVIWVAFDWWWNKQAKEKIDRILK